MSLPFDVLSRHFPSVPVGGGESRGASRRRHVWSAPGRAHIDVRGVHRPGTEGIADAVERALLTIEGVDWAEVNAILARVAVAFDGDVVDVDDQRCRALRQRVTMSVSPARREPNEVLWARRPYGSSCAGSTL